MPQVELSVVIVRCPLPVADNESIRLTTRHTTSHFSLVSSLNRAKETDDIPSSPLSSLHPHCPAKLKSENGRRNRRGKLLKRETSTFPHSYKYKQYLPPLFFLCPLRHTYPLRVSFSFLLCSQTEKKTKNSRTQTTNQGQARTYTETEKRVLKA